MNSNLLIWLNTVSLLVMLSGNYFWGSGALGTTTVGEISAKYTTLITPAGYAFSIWGIIYLLLIAFVVYQWVNRSPEKDRESLEPSGPWFLISNLANLGWLIAWTNDQIGWSLVLMALLLFSLIRLAIRLRLEIWDAPVRIIGLVWWPICIYIGWIVLAAVLNVAVYLKSIGWTGGPLSESQWAITMILAAGLIYLFLTFNRNMRETSFVGIWGLVAIMIALPPDEAAIWWTALVVSVVIFTAANVHAMKNTYTLPFNKIRRGEI